MLKFLLKNEEIPLKQHDCVVLSLVDGKLSHNISGLISKKCSANILEALSTGDICEKISDSATLYNLPGYTNKRIIIVNCGANKQITKTNFIKIINSVAKELKQTKSYKCLINLNLLPVKNADLIWKTQYLIYYLGKSLNQSSQFKTIKTKTKTISIILNIENQANKQPVTLGFNNGKAMYEAYIVSSELANMPGNICTPEFLAQRAAELSKNFNSVKTKTLNKKQLEKQGFGGLLAVGQGSSQEPKFITMEYKSKKATNTKPIIFVGKGITFDSGGISIKPSQDMDIQKYDMTAAAIIIGILHLAAKLELPLHIVGLISAAENLINGDALKPGDIITTLSGKTVEIINTDAEGRLVLCDALTYAKRYDPKIVIDLATLTGNIILALGHSAAGLMTKDDKLAKSIEKASEVSLDKVWRLPLWDEFRNPIKSNIADIKNLGSNRLAAAIVAASFLEYFVEGSYRWAHLDIAGIAFDFGNNKRATGKPIPLLFEFLQQEIRAENE